jgi:hypothetical protein
LDGLALSSSPSPPTKTVFYNQMFPNNNKQTNKQILNQTYEEIQIWYYDDDGVVGLQLAIPLPVVLIVDFVPECVIVASCEIGR